MKQTGWGLIALLFAGVGPAWAQAPPPGPGAVPPAQSSGSPPSVYSPAPPQVAPSAPVDSGRGAAPGPFPSAVPYSPPALGQDTWTNSRPGTTWCPRPAEVAPCAPTQRVWVDAEYLLWWVKQGPLPAPLVTTGSGPASTAGKLGQQGTRILFGDSDLDYGTFSGGRFTVGVWLDQDAVIGLEGQGFFLERRSTGARFASDANGQPLLGAPFFNVLTGLEDIGLISTPGGATGGMSISSSTRFWGADSNIVVNLAREDGWTVDFLGGFRYLDLREDLVLAGATSIQPQAQVTGSSDAPVILPLMALNITDAFATRNQFYGGQLGTRLEYRRGNLFIKLAGKVALGATHEVVDVNGHTSMNLGPGAPVLAAPFGFFTQPTNIGRYTRNDFSVVPEGELRLGYQLTPWLSAFVGYDFLYWSSVVRPGEQVNRVLNQSLDVPGTPLQPAPLFRTTDFWAQGVNFGLELRY